MHSQIYSWQRFTPSFRLSLCLLAFSSVSRGLLISFDPICYGLPSFSESVGLLLVLAYFCILEQLLCFPVAISSGLIYPCDLLIHSELIYAQDEM